MRLSVIVPVYNKAPYLRACIESIFAQTHADFELIAVDDRSTDDSLDILRGFTDDRLRVIALERNLGPAGAAQRAIDAAQCEYIVRVDADDICLPHRFERQLAFMEANPGLIASGCHLQLFGDENLLRRYPTGQTRAGAELLFNNPVAQGASIMRASLLRKHGLRYHDDWPRIGEDWIYWTYLYKHGGFDNVDEALVLYRRSESNSDVGLDRTLYRERIIREVFGTLGIPLGEHELVLHLLLLRSFKQPPSAELLRATREWMKRLRRINQQVSLFDERAFDARLGEAWSSLFFWLHRQSPGLALRHWLMGPAREPGKLSYAAKSMLNRWLGRAPNA
jgi:glycosyltransferase involved in cell wall biosynthesis